MESLDKLFRPIKIKVAMMIGRGILAAINNAGVTQLLQIKLLAGELATDVERFEDYGLSSYPIAGAQVLGNFINGNRHQGVVVCVHDRRCRPNYLSSGEVSLYSHEDKSGDNHRIHFKAGKTINIKCTTKDEDIGGNVTQDVGGNVTITISGNETVTVSSHQTNATTIILNGQTTIGGVSGSGKTLATADLLNIFNNHVHSGITAGGANSGKPTSTLSTSNFTSATKAS